MRKESLSLLEQLIATPSPSGFEQPVQRVLQEAVSDWADEVRTDLHGNLIAVKNPGVEPRVMLAGHCDQIGFMVQHITDEGFIRFSAIGGVDTTLVGRGGAGSGRDRQEADTLAGAGGAQEARGEDQQALD